MKINVLSANVLESLALAVTAMMRLKFMLNFVR